MTAPEGRAVEGGLDRYADPCRAQSLPEVSMLDKQLARVMFAASLLFLANLASLLHLTEGDLWSSYAEVVIRTGALLHMAFVVEGFVHLVWGSGLKRWHWWAILIPPLRLGARDHLAGTCVWLPVWGWQPAGVGLEKRLARFFSVPLMCLAMLVLPLVLIELIWVEMLNQHPVWMKSLEIASGFIWMAFVIEFVIMVGVTPKKFRYIRRNWIDVIIILLPLVSFLRGLRLARLMRLNQISRTARIYRVRGLLIRAWRALVALDLIEKVVWRDKDALIDRLGEELVERETELEELRVRIAKLKLRHRKEESGDQRDGTVG